MDQFQFKWCLYCIWKEACKLSLNPTLFPSIMLSEALCFDDVISSIKLSRRCAVATPHIAQAAVVYTKCFAIGSVQLLKKRRHELTSCTSCAFRVFFVCVYFYFRFIKVYTCIFPAIPYVVIVFIYGYRHESNV